MGLFWLFILRSSNLGLFRVPFQQVAVGMRDEGNGEVGGYPLKKTPTPSCYVRSVLRGLESHGGGAWP